MEVSVQLHAPAALPQRNNPWYPLDRRMDGPQICQQYLRYTWDMFWKANIQNYMSRKSSVITPTSFRARRPEFDYRQGQRPVLGHTQPPIYWVPWALFLWVKRLGREAAHLRQVPRSRIREATSPLPPYAFMAWCLIKLWKRLHVVVLR
jgi:hypothetical protein